MKARTLFFFLTFLFSTSVFADVIQFQSRVFFYRLITTSEEIRLKGYLIDLNLQKRDCNHRLIQSFKTQVEGSFQKIVLHEKDYYSVSWNNKDFKIYQKSQLGRFLFNIPEKVKSLKKKESFLCALKIK